MPELSMREFVYQKQHQQQTKPDSASQASSSTPSTSHVPPVPRSSGTMKRKSLRPGKCKIRKQNTVDGSVPSKINEVREEGEMPGQRRASSVINVKNSVSIELDIVPSISVTTQDGIASSSTFRSTIVTTADTSRMGSTEITTKCEQV